MSFLKKKPSLFVLMSASGVLSGGSNYICQRYIEKREKVDYVRVAHFAGLISCCVVPIAHKWMHVLEKAFPVPSSSSFFIKLKPGVLRVVADQIIGAPVLTGIVLFSLNALETRSIDTAFNRTYAIFWDVVFENWKVWPIVQFVNLIFVPVHYRIMVIQFVSFFWNIFISYIQHESDNKSILFILKELLLPYLKKLW